MFFMPMLAFAGKPSVDYNSQIVVTVQPNLKLSKALKGIDLKKIKNLKIEDTSHGQVSLDFWDSYNILKKMTGLETLDITGCKSLNGYFYDYRYKAPLPITNLILNFSHTHGFPNNAVYAALYFKIGETPIKRLSDNNNFPNLKEVILAGENSNLQSMCSTDAELYANLYFSNLFVASYNPQTKLIRFTRTTNPYRTYHIIVDGTRENPNITPNNKLLENVVVADASFAKYLPKSVSKLTIPASVINLLGDYCSTRTDVDSLIVEDSNYPLIINKGGLYGLKVNNAIFNRPTRIIEPGIDVFGEAEIIIFNKPVSMSYGNLGYGIKRIVFNDEAQINSSLADNVGEIVFNDDVSITYDHNNSSREIIRGAKELIFKKTPDIEDGAKFDEVDKVFIPKGTKEKCTHSIMSGAKEMDFGSMTIVDPRIQPKEGLKIKPLRFDDKHLHDVEQAGTNRVLYMKTKPGKSLGDGFYYVPVSDNLYLSYSNENSTLKNNAVELSAGYFYNMPWNILETHIMVFSYIPVENINGIEYGRTVGFYIVNPKYGEIVADFTYYATQQSNRKTPYIPPKPKKKTYHERGRVEDCGICLGTGMGWQGGYCPFCGGKGWYIEHEW